MRPSKKVCYELPLTPHRWRSLQFDRLFYKVPPHPTSSLSIFEGVRLGCCNVYFISTWIKTFPVDTFAVRSVTFQTDGEEMRLEVGGRGTGHCVRLDNRAATASCWSSRPRPGGSPRVGQGDFIERDLWILI